MMTSPLSRALHALGLLAVIVFTLFPFYWMVSSSLKQQSDLLASPPLWIFNPTLDHYRAVLADPRARAGFGGAPRLLASALLEQVFSTLQAPVHMAYYTRFVASTLAGRIAACRASEDLKEGLLSFKEKRKPVFRGR